jgi:hypothetical protein
MPIRNPILDDRSYQQLRDELVLRIPVYTPEWTDHNASDPGITLIELFSFLGENLLYRFNQIPEAARLEFLRLLQIPLRPATPARALVTFTTSKREGVLVTTGAELTAGKLSFETETEVHVWPVSFVAIGRQASPEPDRDKEPEVYQFAVSVLDAIGPLAREQRPVYYKNDPVDLTNPPVDFNATVDGRIWIAVVRAKDVKKEDLKGALLNVGVVLDPVFEAMDQVRPCPGAGFIAKAPAVEWKVSTGAVINGKPQYISISQEGDTTRGLTQDGVVRLRLPHDVNQVGVFDLKDPAQGGTGDFPPVLDEETEKNILCWIFGFRHDGSGFGKVQFIAANAAETVQTKKALTEFLGTGNAQPNQHFKLVYTPVIAGSLKLDVEEASGWVEWKEVDGFHASDPDDRHFVLDPEAGEVRFGNGLQGLPPQIGQRLRAREYRFGGGVEGNVAPDKIKKAVAFGDVKVTNPLRARGGAAAEKIEEGLTRIPGELRRRDRAVTATDFQELALATPGADVGRAECLPRFHPPTRKSEAAGINTVVIWPSVDAAHPNAPTPDRNLLRTVCQWLDMRRLVTTELYVIPPAYRQVAVSVALEVKDGYGIEAVRNWVELVLRQYLAPLPPYGPEGQGWPLGRKVHGPELEAAALQVEGVRFLNDLRVAGWNAAQRLWVNGSVTLQKYEVVELTSITVVEGPTALDPGKSVDPAPSGTPLPVPVIREEC